MRQEEAYKKMDVFDKISENEKEWQQEFEDDLQLDDYKAEFAKLAFGGINTETFEHFFWVFRWAINGLFFGIPWFVLSIAGLVYNLYFNIAWNRIWGGGNIWLIVNTLIAIG